jgi:DNA adenine methylase
MKKNSLKPFLKWAGGKRWLFKSGQFSLPRFTGRYLEPFLGGGAVFFQSQPKNAILSDSNERLIELYTAIRDDLAEFQKILKKHSKLHTTDYYYEVRSKKLKTPTSRAAQFLYLNRTCWNGLYRENLKGQFNVPIGTKQTVIFESDDFEAWSKALSDTSLMCQDFEGAINEAREGDFIFVDPPYTVRHNTNGFVKYNQKIFTWEDQVRLHDALVSAANRGAAFAMTNADHKSIRELYNDLGKHNRLNRYSVIAGDSAYRSQSTELLVTY